MHGNSGFVAFISRVNRHPIRSSSYYTSSEAKLDYGLGELSISLISVGISLDLQGAFFPWIYCHQSLDPLKWLRTVFPVLWLS